MIMALEKWFSRKVCENVYGGVRMAHGITRLTGWLSICIQSTNFINMPAQIRFTQAVAEWLDDESKKHYCRCEIAKMGDMQEFPYSSTLSDTQQSCPGQALGNCTNRSSKERLEFLGIWHTPDITEQFLRGHILPVCEIENW
jgi:hypothetical protein